jgi:hypothetical protein
VVEYAGQVPGRLRPRTPYPIAALPGALLSAPRPMLLLCGPEQGGWRRGRWKDGAWRDPDDPAEPLVPSHFALLTGWRAGREPVRPVLRLLLYAGLAWSILAVGSALLAPDLGQDLWALCSPAAGAAR